MHSKGHASLRLSVRHTRWPQRTAGPKPVRATRRIAIAAAGGLGILLGAGWLGLQIGPQPFPGLPVASTPSQTLELPAGLPAPVERYFRAIYGERIPQIDSAVLAGRGHLRVSGVTFPARLRFIHVGGAAYRHYIEATWFGFPLLRVNERYVDGRARLELPVGVVANEPKVDQGANLALWGEEAFWLPSVLITDPRIRLEPVNSTTARLIVPFGDTTDRFTVSFNRQSGLLERLEALRYRSATDNEKIPWIVEPVGWQIVGGLCVPNPVALTWQDEGRPWLVVTIEEAAYNVWRWALILLGAVNRQDPVTAAG